MARSGVGAFSFLPSLRVFSDTSRKGNLRECPFFIYKFCGDCMANIEKIVKEEILKVKAELNQEKNIFLKGTEEFDNCMNNIVLQAYRREDEKYLAECEIIIRKEVDHTIDRFTFIFSNGILFRSIFYPVESKKNIFVPYYAILTFLRKKVERKIANENIDDHFIDLEKVLSVKISWDSHPITATFDISKRDPFLITSKDIFDESFDGRTKKLFYEMIIRIVERIKNDDKKDSQLMDDISEAYEKEDWDLVLEISNEMLEMFPERHWLIAFKSKAYLEKNDLQNATKFNKIALEKFYNEFGDISKSSEWDENDKAFYSLEKCIEAKIMHKNNDFINSFRSYNDSIQFISDEEERQDVINQRDKVHEELLKNFNRIKYNDRTVIYIDNELSLYNPTNIVPIEKSKTASLNFPPPHPISKQLYVGHPFKENLYFPIEDYENYLFESQVMELSRILKSLGAKTIKTEYIIGSTTSENYNETKTSNEKIKTDGSLSGSGVIYSGGTSASNEQSIQAKHNQQNEINNIIGKKINIDGVFNPKMKPYIPDDLIWFQHNEVWQSIAQQRMEGGLEKYDITLSTKNVEQLSEKELKQIDKEYKNLIKGSVGTKLVKVNSEINTNKSEDSGYESLLEKKKKGTTNLRILVDFVPMEELTEDPPVKLVNQQTAEGNLVVSNNDIEYEYLELLKDAVEDGKIDASARKFLNRRREKLGISEEKASQLENMLLKGNQLNDSEKEYIEELKFCLEDNNEISEKERKLLNRLRDKLNILVDRAIELEKNINKY